MIKKFFSQFGSRRRDSIAYHNYIRVEYSREFNFLVKNGLSEEQAVYAISNKVVR